MTVFNTKRALRDALTEAHEAILKLVVHNQDLTRVLQLTQQALEATQNHVEACKNLIAAYEHKAEATEHFLAVLQGEQIAIEDNNTD